MTTEATAAADPLEALAPREIRVEISTGPLIITPIRIKELPAFARAIEPFAQQIIATQGDDLDVVELLTCNMEEALTAVAIGARLSREALDALTLEDLAELAAAVIEVNLDFFTRRVLPRVSRLTEVLMRRLDGPTSSIASSAPAGA